MFKLKNRNSKTVNPNSPVWTPRRPRGQEQFQEVWSLKLNDRNGQEALWLRFTLLVTKNGFQRMAETWGIFFKREANKEISKTAVKQSFGIDSFQTLGSPSTTGPTSESASESGSETDFTGIQIGESRLTATSTRGQIHSKGKSISWDLEVQTIQKEAVSLMPRAVRKLGFLKNETWTISEELLFTGNVIVNGVTYTFEGAPGTQRHWSGERSADSWVWGQANSFQSEQGEPVPFIFEGITARARLKGNLLGPKISSYYFFYRNQHYRFNTLWDALHLKSENSITEWKFQADRGELSFRGVVKAELKDFAGVTYEDTDSSVLHCASSKLSEMKVHVYRRGKLESTQIARGTAAFEIVSRKKNPYIQSLL